LDKWILSRLGELIKETTEWYERYQLDKATRPLALFIDDLSTWYLRRSRERFKEETPDKKAALTTLRQVLFTLAHLMAPATPFFAEYLYRAVQQKGDPESVHLSDWPGPLPVDRPLLSEMKQVRLAASEGLQLRERAGIKIRQPLARFLSPTKFSFKWSAQIVAQEVNVKEVLQAAEAQLDTALTPELQEEGRLRELVRRIQEWRKLQKLSITDRPLHTLNVSKEEEAVAQKYRDKIIAETGLKDLVIETH
jgi:isoleucyl-tRNA synthetase